MQNHRKSGAGNESRTRDLNLGKVALFHLSYSRLATRRNAEPEMLARSAGFEPTTPWFVARYSIQLSYERVKEAAHYSNPIHAVNTRPPTV